MSMTDPREIQCPHCHGVGRVAIPPEVATVEAYYFGCQRQSGHHWWRPNRTGTAYDVSKIVAPSVASHIDGGFCPGAVKGDSWGRTRPEVEGEAALHHIDGWTVFAFWDRSVDARGACNSNFVARGTHSYPIMCAIAEAQFPDVWNRFKFEVRLVEPADVP